MPADRRPPPLYLASGLTDDLFPADEVLRYANRTSKRYPDLPMSILLGDFGHQRASNKPRRARTAAARDPRWFDHYLRDRGRPPRIGVTAFAQTCPARCPAGRAVIALRVSPILRARSRCGSARGEGRR